MRSFAILVIAFICVSITIAVFLFAGYLAIKMFCRPYRKEDEQNKQDEVWSDGLESDYEHEMEVYGKHTGYFNFFIPTFFISQSKD